MFGWIRRLSGRRDGERKVEASAVPFISTTLVGQANLDDNRDRIPYPDYRLTEEEWMSPLHESSMLNFVASDKNKRKILLFCYECLRLRWWKALVSQKSKEAIELAEKIADGLLPLDRFEEAYSLAEQGLNEVDILNQKAPFNLNGGYAAALVKVSVRYITRLDFPEYEIAESLVGCIRHCVEIRGKVKDELGNLVKYEDFEKKIHFSIIRDIFGNPFRPVTLDPRWQTTTVTDLARSIYDNRAFDQMPILADALEDAGCDNPEILRHCRGDGPHVKGCWVVDLILGKE